MRALLHWLETHPKHVAAAFFVCVFTAGARGFWDFGVSWDEPGSMKTGKIAYEYVVNGTPYPRDFHNRAYGTVFDLPVVGMIHTLGIDTPRGEFLLKHFLTFVVFFLATIVFYLLCLRQFRSAWTALLGAVFLVFSPRIFGEAFYNPKDIPQLAFFTFAIYTLTRFLEKKSWRWLLIHAAVCALAVGVRLTSMIVPAMTVFFLLVLTWRREGGRWAPALAKSAAFLAVCAVVLVAVWPFLWRDPVAGFLEAYGMMTSYNAEGFFLGEKITSMPWSYIPVWIAITTPLLYSALFVGGVVSLLHHARRPLEFLTRRTGEAIAGMWFFLPILAVFVSGAGIYDGWRHLYFVYPGFLLIALMGVRPALLLLARLRLPVRPTQAFAGLIVLHSLWLGLWMWRYHPVQSTYFSIPARFVQHNFELDYWGLSYRPAFEKLLALDSSPVILVWAASSPAWSTLDILPPEQRRRINMVDEAYALYALDNYRYDGYAQDSTDEEIGAIMAGGVKILSIYRLQ